MKNTATDCAPWYVVPADHKWLTRLFAAGVIVDALESLELRNPTVSATRRNELAAVRATLLANQV